MMSQAQPGQDSPELVIDVIVMHDANDAWVRVRDSFAIAGLPVSTRFDAIDGTCLTAHELRSCVTPRAEYELSVGRRFPFGWVHEGLPSIGAVGCYLSHLELWKRAAQRSVPTLILEQDAEPVVSPETILKALADIPAETDVAFLGHLALFKPKLWEKLSTQAAAGFHPVLPTSDVFCTHAYLVTPDGARKLVERAMPINAQVDAFMRFLCTPHSGLRMVFHSPSLIDQRAEEASSIQTRGTTLDYLLQGSMMASRAAFNGIMATMGRAWQWVRRR